MYPTRQHVVDEKNRLVVLAAQGYVQHHDDVGIHGFYRSSARIEQLRQLIQVADLAFRPNDAVVDFIADLHHVGRSALVFQFLDDLFGIIIHRFFQLRKG